MRVFRADPVMPIMERERKALAHAETRLNATQDALASLPVEAPRDRLLDFALDLRDAVAGRTANTSSVQQRNHVLTELFDSFVIHSPDDGLWHVTDNEVRALGTAVIEPLLRIEVVEALMESSREDGWDSIVPPPMAWIDAVDNSDNSHLHSEKSRMATTRGVTLPLILASP